MRKRLIKLFKNKFVKNVFIVASGTAMAQIIAFALMPIITRIFDPEAYGLFGTFLAIAAIIGPVSALSYPIAIVLPKSEEKAKTLIKLSLIVSIIMSMVSLIILISFSNPIASILKKSTVPTMLYLIPLVILFSGFLQIAMQWLTRTHQFNIKAKVTVFQSLLVNGSKVGIGLVYPVGITLTIIHTAGIFIQSVAIILINKSKLFPLGNFNIKEMLNVAFEYKDFLLFRSPQVLINTASNSLPVILLASFFGPGSAGLYSLSLSALKTPTNLIGQSIQEVFYPKASEAINNNKNVYLLLKKSVLILALLGLIPFGIIIFYGPVIFELFFGSEWERAGVYAQWVALFSYSIMVTRPVVASIAVLNIQKQFLIFEITSVICKISALLIGYRYFKSDIHSIALFCSSAVILYLALTIYVFLVAKTNTIADRNKNSI